MRTRSLGTTGLAVSELGLGAGPLGDERLADAAAERLIHGALELGITLIDTAPSYGRSEARIGAALRGRRDRVVLSTKLGYGVPGVPDWTGPCITGGIELALERLGTTWLDVAHLHSCPQVVLERGDVIDALDAAVRAGKLRVAAYSGDNGALAWAIDSGRFGVVQCSVNVADQRALDRSVPVAAARGIGVLAKRPLANAAWREPERPDAPDRATYWDRVHAMGLTVTAESALAFVLAQPGISSVLVGTTSLDHLRTMTEVHALGAAAADEIRTRFRRHDRGWDGVI
ncbi:MAG TPA: aldo/keto reductase [Kofleriaceae bacterium]|nr:aldo/keto reductase [Kofleriaceae bacterium]